MSMFLVCLLAVVQGITEFLPISSSGHLAILADVCGQPLESLELTIALHLGSFVAIGIYYWRRIVRLFRQDWRTMGWLVIGTLPAVCVGLPLKKYAESFLANPLVAAGLLPITALVLVWTQYLEKGTRDYVDMGWRSALRIGCWQAAAILPGLSRSGLTIAGGMREGLTPQAAAAFSFLLALPAILGAGVLETVSVWRQGEWQTASWKLALGAAISCMVGLGALRCLDRSLQRGRLFGYSVWCIVVSASYFTWRLAG